MTSTNDSAPDPGGPPDIPLSAADLREREDALTSSLVDAFVQTREAKGALEAFEIKTLAAAAALVAEQTARVSGQVARHAELPERSMVAEFATASRAPERTVRAQMADAADLCARFAPTVTALAEGRISRSHVGVIHEAGFAIDDAEARAGFESVAIARAEQMTAGRLRPIVRLLAAKANPRTIDERHAQARALRAVRLVDLPDGMAELIATLPATLAHGAFDRLTQQAKAIIKARPAAAPSDLPNDADSAIDASKVGSNSVEPDTRCMDELRADIFSDLLLTGTAVTCIEGDGLSAIRATVQVTVPVLTAAGVGSEPAILAGHGPVDADTARRLLGGAKGWERVMTDPVTGGVLAVDRRHCNKALTRFLRARDERCRFPGCRMPVWRCEVDHTIDHALGGETCACNLAHLCKNHHILKGNTAWTVRQLGAGVLEWTSPTGRVYIDQPEPTLRFVPTDTPRPGPTWATTAWDDPECAAGLDGDPPPF